MSSDLHRRKSSREENVDNVLEVSGKATELKLDATTDTSHRETVEHPNVNGLNNPNTAYATGIPQRQRVLSTPSHLTPPTLYSPVPNGQPPSPGPYRASIAGPSSPALQPPSHLRHARTASASAFYPPTPSPLSMSFPADGPSSPTLPSPHRQAPPPPDRRRHSRIHSRNLSIFFPRPGAPPPASIAEDGAQELEIRPPPETIISSAPLQQGRELQRGFRFGGGKQSGENETPDVPEDSQHVPPSSAGLVGGTATRPSRRGHHHKHSLSHNFFSFMEPEASVSPSHTPKTASLPFPSSPWQPISPIHTSSAKESVASHPQPLISSTAKQKPLISPATLVSITQFALGSALWLRGQECGSLSCTGLGYWIVFDAIGVVCSGVLPSYLTSGSPGSCSRFYGNSRVETLAVFAQSIYLIFTSIYVFKETVEHVLLSHGEGHHHHHQGDDTELRLELPIILISISLLSLVVTSVWFDNHSRLLHAAANRIPSLSSLIHSLRYTSISHLSRPSPAPPPVTPLGKALSNPYTATPVGTALAVLSIYGVLHFSQQRPADLALAGLLAVVTLSIAYPAALALAKVLLQTAPRRGAIDGRMEAFLRTMRDIERHPQVLHLPPPHMWQLTPARPLEEPAATLIVTMELHVRRDADDAAVFALTRWAWERCMGALGSMGTEVTVGVVKG